MRSNCPIHRLTVFFLKMTGNAVTINGERYRQMIELFLVPEVNQLGFQSIWFQQDDTTVHTAYFIVLCLQSYAEFRGPIRCIYQTK